MLNGELPHEKPGAKEQWFKLGAIAFQPIVLKCYARICLQILAAYCPRLNEQCKLRLLYTLDDCKDWIRHCGDGPQ